MDEERMRKRYGGAVEWRAGGLGWGRSTGNIHTAGSRSFAIRFCKLIFRRATIFCRDYGRRFAALFIPPIRPSLSAEFSADLSCPRLLSKRKTVLAHARSPARRFGLRETTDARCDSVLAWNNVTGGIFFFGHHIPFVKNSRAAFD